SRRCADRETRFRGRPRMRLRIRSRPLSKRSVLSPEMSSCRTCWTTCGIRRTRCPDTAPRQRERRNYLLNGNLREAEIVEAERMEARRSKKAHDPIGFLFELAHGIR